MRTLFLDSSFLIAYILNNDSLHEKAVEIVHQKDIFNKYKCCISNDIINEVITIIGNKGGLNKATESYYILKDSFTILNENNILNFNDEVMNIYMEYNTKLSFTDSAILRIIEEYDVDYLLTFDKLLNKSAKEKSFFFPNA